MTPGRKYFDYSNALKANTGIQTVKQRPLVGVAVVVCRDDKFLLGKRKNSHGAGSWQFPGGHLELNESIEACAAREIFEETGITIKNLRLTTFTNDIFDKESKHYVTLFVAADHGSGEAQVREPEKCEEWGWFEPENLPSPLFLPIKNLFKRNITLQELVSKVRV